jgi:hypothetical protein
MKKQCSNFPTSIEIGNITSIVWTGPSKIHVYLEFQNVILLGNWTTGKVIKDYSEIILD